MGRRKPLAREINLIHYRLDLLKHFRIRKPQHKVPVPLKPARSSTIVRLPHEMTFAIQVDRESQFCAPEVCDEATERLLSTELEAAESAIA